MRYSEAKYGRVFIIRLEDGDILHEEIERFATEKQISSAALMVLGGADAGAGWLSARKRRGECPLSLWN